MAEPHSIDDLLENATWLRVLAAQMLSDHGHAEDAVQETWIAALRERPDPAQVRPWLARVVRNFALQRRRSESARRTREQSVARPELRPSAQDTVARAELHAKLVQAVLALDEPYRTTLLWRYFEGLSAEDIAVRARIDPATVRSRVARARAKLRAALTEQDGESPERWLAALAPIARAVPDVHVAASSGALAGVGGSLLSTKLIVALGVVALIAAVFVVRGFERDDPAHPTGIEGLAPADGLADSARERTDDALPTPNESRAAVGESESPAQNASSSAAKWRGLVLSEDGRVPLVGARISYRRGSEIDPLQQDVESRTREGTRSDAHGGFELAVSVDLEDGLWFEADGHFPHKLSAGDLPRDREQGLEVVLAPLGRIELEIVDDELAPHVDLPVRYSIDLNRGSQDYMWSYRRDFAAGRTDPAGRLVIADVPCGMQIDLRTGFFSFGANFLGVVHIDPRERVLHHQIKLPRTATIVGRLVHADHRPAVGLELEWQSYPLDYGDPLRATVGVDGAFRIVGVPPKPGELRWNVPGFEPVELAPGVGETIDLGERIVPSVVELSGRLTSRWLAGDDLPRALQSVAVRALRGGRVLAPLLSNEGAIPLENGRFELHVAGGPLELIVTRGGYWFSGMQMPREVLARVTLPMPSAGLEIGIDDHLGALDVDLSELAPAEGEHATLKLFGVPSAKTSNDLFVATALVRAEPRVRFAPLTPGRYRALLRFGDGREATLGELEITSGVATECAATQVSSRAVFGVVRTVGGVPVHQANVEWSALDGQGNTLSDAEGRFRIGGLSSGPLDLIVRHGDHGIDARRGLEVFAPETEVDVVLAGFATVVGRVSIEGRPAAQLAIGAQPVNSNDTYSAITDDEGSFRIERLPACRLRVWSSGSFVEVLELAAGETRELTVELGARKFVHFLRSGEPLSDVHGVRALAFGPDSGADAQWRTGVLRGGGVDLDVPEGRVLFDVSRARSGSNTSYVAVVDRPGGDVELARHTLVLDGGRPWSGVLPRANLVSVEGRAVVSMWGGEIVLAVERDANGSAIVPCVPDGARVRLTGFDARGRRCERVVDVPATLFVEWP